MESSALFFDSFGACSKQDRLLQPPSMLRVLCGKTILYVCERHKLLLSPVRCTHSSHKGVATSRSLRDASGSSSFPNTTLSFAFLASLREAEAFSVPL